VHSLSDSVTSLPFPCVAADMYEVIDSSLSDIKYALDPAYSSEDIAALDQRSTLASDVMGVKYLPGMLRISPRCLPMPHRRLVVSAVAAA
jgi:hypothetical protein